MIALIEARAKIWSKGSGADLAAIARLEQELKRELPENYKEFLLWSNGGEAELPQTRFEWWSVEEIIQRNNDFQVWEYIPDVIMIADDTPVGFGLQYDSSSSLPTFITVPLDGLDKDTVTFLGNSFTEGMFKLLDMDHCHITGNEGYIRPYMSRYANLNG